MAGFYLSSPYHFLFYIPNQMDRPIVLTTIVVVSTACNDLFNFLFFVTPLGYFLLSFCNSIFLVPGNVVIIFMAEQNELLYKKAELY